MEQDIVNNMKCVLCDKETKTIIAEKLRHGEKKNVYYCVDCELGMLQDDRSEGEIRKMYDVRCTMDEVERKSIILQNKSEKRVAKSET